ncbi:MAG: hypothetical protein GY861_00275 [bacterium]|nr:hypothetical protein [bacterium]
MFAVVLVVVYSVWFVWLLLWDLVWFVLSSSLSVLLFGWLLVSFPGGFCFGGLVLVGSLFWSVVCLWFLWWCCVGFNSCEWFVGASCAVSGSISFFDSTLLSLVMALVLVIVVVGSVVVCFTALSVFILFFVVMEKCSPAGLVFISSLVVSCVPFTFGPELADGSGRPYVLVDFGFDSQLDFCLSSFPNLRATETKDSFRVVLSD